MDTALRGGGKGGAPLDPETRTDREERAPVSPSGGLVPTGAADPRPLELPSASRARESMSTYCLTGFECAPRCSASRRSTHEQQANKGVSPSGPVISPNRVTWRPARSQRKQSPIT